MSVRGILSGAVVAALALAGCTGEVTGTGTLAALPSRSAPVAPAPAAAPCPGAAVATRPAALATRMPATTARRLPLDRDDNGPLTLDQLSAGYDEPIGDARHVHLIEAGFREAFVRGWEREGRGTYSGELLYLYRFATPEGACHFAATEAERFRYRPVRVPGVPGAVGRPTNEGVWQASMLATKGPYVIASHAQSPTPAVVSWTADLLRGTYDRL